MYLKIHHWQIGQNMPSKYAALSNVRYDENDVFAGTEEWVQKLLWPGLQFYNSATRHGITSKVTGKNVAYVKSYKNFYFYWVLDAGHMVRMSSFSNTKHSTYRGS